MKSENVYVIKCSSGSWDSYCWWIGGIFDSEEKAIAEAEKLHEEAVKIKAECPVNFGSDEVDDNEYWDYYYKNEAYMEWDKPTVHIHALNERRKID